MVRIGAEILRERIEGMGLEKAIEHGKEKRKPYIGAKAVDCTCRNHGSCEWCKGNRTYKNSKKNLKVEQEIKEYEIGGFLGVYDK